jgi:hypothetical protein
MAKEYDFECSAHPVLEGIERKQHVYFSVPEEVNEQTGFLLLIAGFGGNPLANVYKKMRKVFALDCRNDHLSGLRVYGCGYRIKSRQSRIK